MGEATEQDAAAATVAARPPAAGSSPSPSWSLLASVTGAAYLLAPRDAAPVVAVETAAPASTPTPTPARPTPTPTPTPLGPGREHDGLRHGEPFRRPTCSPSTPPFPSTTTRSAR